MIEIPKWENADDLDIFIDTKFMCYVSTLEKICPSIQKILDSEVVKPSLEWCDRIVCLTLEADIAAELGKEHFTKYFALTLCRLAEAYRMKQEGDVYACLEALERANEENTRFTLMHDYKYFDAALSRDADMGHMLPSTQGAAIFSSVVRDERQDKLQQGKSRKKQTKATKIISLAREIGWNAIPLTAMAQSIWTKLNPTNDQRGLSMKTIYQELKDNGYQARRTGGKPRI